MKEKTWQEFRESGMLWFVNMILHTFGWSIVLDVDVDKDGIEEVVGVKPYKVNFRGFSEETNAKGYEKVGMYLEKNIHEINKDAFIVKR